MEQKTATIRTRVVGILPVSYYIEIGEGVFLKQGGDTTGEAEQARRFPNRRSAAKYAADLGYKVTNQ